MNLIPLINGSSPKFPDNDSVPKSNGSHTVYMAIRVAMDETYPLVGMRISFSMDYVYTATHVATGLSST